MGLLKTLFTNCAHPKGRMGRAMLKFMNLCHAPLTNWGLSLVDIQEGWTMSTSATVAGRHCKGFSKGAKMQKFMASTSLRRVWQKPDKSMLMC